MEWKPIVGQFVVANLGGRLERLRVTDYNTATGAVRVIWPPHDGVGVSVRVFTEGRTDIPRGRYAPVDPQAFRTLTGA